jgi:hypothetical protein
LKKEKRELKREREFFDVLTLIPEGDQQLAYAF